VPFQPLFSSNEQYSVEELLPSIWLLDRAVGDRSVSDLRCLDLVVDSASRLAHQSSHSGLRDIIDWWIVCRLNGEPTYCSAPNAFGTTGLDADLIDHLRAMVGKRGATGARPVIEWMTKRRTYDSMVKDLQTKLGEWRNTKGIRNVGHLVNLLEDVVGEAITSLKEGRQPSRPLTNSEIDRFFKDTDIHQGSNLFRQWSRNLKNAGASMNTAIELLPQIEPFGLAGVRVDQVGNGKLSGLSEDFHQATSILLRGILREPPDRTPNLIALFAELSSEEEIGINYGQLAVLTEAIDDGGISFPSYQELTRLRADIPGLRRSGRDLDLVEMYLDAGMIEEARLELELLRQEQRNSQVLISLAKSADRLTDLLGSLRSLGLDTDTFLQEIEDFRTRLRDQDTESLRSKLNSIDSQIIEASQQLLTTRSHEIIQNISQLQVGERDIAAGVAQKRDDIFQSGELQARILLIDELNDLLQSMYSERKGELRDTVLRLQSFMQDDLDNDEIVSIVSAASDFADADDAFADLMRLREESIKLERDLEAKKVATWRYRDGEPALVEHVVRYMMERTGFSELDIKRFYASLKTKRFVILGGLPGTGKSIFSKVFCESLDCTSKNGRFVRVAVRPNWTDPSEVLGRVDPLNNVFIPGWLSTLIKRCHADSPNPYFCLLDEMNLAPLEQYFAEVLSALEEEAPNRDERSTLTLYSDGISPDNGHEWPSHMSLPTNLYFIATVNFDPTTNAISDRVVDRGNFIQLANQIGRQHHSDIAEFSESRWILQQIEWERTISHSPDPNTHDFLVELGELLEDFRIGIGFRTHVEVEKYLANSKGVMNDTQALDTAILQRFIPKFRDFTMPAPTTLHDLWQLLRDRDLRYSAAVIRYWIDVQSGYNQPLNGLDPFLGVVISRIERDGQEESPVVQPETWSEPNEFDDSVDEPETWESAFLRESTPLPRRQDDFLRSLVIWTRSSLLARGLGTEGITCDSIVNLVRRYFGYIDWSVIVTRLRAIVREENSRPAPMPMIDIVFSHIDGRAVEVVKYRANDGRGQPEGWRRRAVQELADHASNPDLLIGLISWLADDSEASKLLHSGIEVGDIGSVAADLGYSRSGQPLTSLIQELLESDESLSSRLELDANRSQPVIRWT